MIKSNKAKSRMLMFVLIFVAVALVSMTVAQASVSSTVNSITSGIKGGISKYKISAVNGLIIAALLFILQSFFAKGITDKNQRTIVQALLVAFAIFLAFWNPILKAQYLWKLPWAENILHLKVIVNLVIIGVCVYIVASFLKLQDKVGGADKGKIVMILIAVVISASIALQPFEGGKKYNDATYQFVWEYETVIDARLFLFGDTNCVFNEDVGGKIVPSKYCYTKDSKAALIAGTESPKTVLTSIDSEDSAFEGFGVLRGMHLFILIGLGLLFYWFFSTMGIIGEMKWLNGVIAYLIASSMAHSGTTVEKAVLLGQALFAIILFKAIDEKSPLKNLFKDRPQIGTVLNGILSLGLTQWLATLAFKDKASFTWFPYGLISGTFSTMGWIGAIILGTIIIVALVFIIGSSKKDKAHKQGKMWGYLRQKRVRIQNKIFMRIPGLREILRRTKSDRDIIQEGTLGDEFRVGFPTFQILMNWMLRLEVFLNKKSTVVNRRNEAMSIYGYGSGKIDLPDFEPLGNETSFARFRTQMEYFKNGARLKVHNGKNNNPFIPDNEIGYSSKYPKMLGSTDCFMDTPRNTYIEETYLMRNTLNYGDEEEIKGGIQTYLPVLKLYETMIVKINDPTKNDWVKDADIGGQLTENLEEFLQIAMTRVTNNMNSGANDFAKAFLKYGIIKFINARREFMLDQYLMFGENVHSYRFATPIAKVSYYDYKIKEDEGVRKLIENKKFLDMDLGDEKYISVNNAGKANRYVVMDIEPIRGMENIPILHAWPNQPNMSRKRDILGNMDDQKRDEVWFDGKYVEDINIINAKIKCGYSAEEIKREHPTIRRVTPFVYGKTVTHNAMYHKIMEYDLIEWDGWISDMLVGEFKQNSRSWLDYYDAREKGKNYFMTSAEKAVPEQEPHEHEGEHSHEGEHGEDHGGIHKHIEIGDPRPAFDRQALGNPGSFYYWGRYRWNGLKLANLNEDKPISPYPGISVKGLTEYLKYYLEQRLEQDDEFLNNFNLFVIYSGDPHHPFARAREVIKLEKDKEHH